MRSGVGRFSIPVAALAALAVLLAATRPAPAAPTAQAASACLGRSAALLLWPHGHRRLRHADPPPLSVASAELYRRAGRYRSGDFLASIDGNGKAKSVARCGGRAARVGRVPRARTRRTASAVTCRLSRRSRLVIVDRTPMRLAVLTRPGTPVLVATIDGGRAHVTFDRSRCRARRAPS